MSNKVLIVEDELIVANDLRLILERAGYKVTGIAASFEEAEELLQQTKPDLVLLDIRLKGELSGIDLARKLKAQNIPFIYLSANSSQKILEEAKTTVPYGFLVKPFRKRDLLVTLDIAWYRHQYSLESRLHQEDLLKKQIADISNEVIDSQSKLLKLARIIQYHIPFDLIAMGSGPLFVAQFNDVSYLRIGFDEYQFIGVKEFVTITGLKGSSLSQLNAYSHTNAGEVTDNGRIIVKKEGLTAPQEILFKCFNLESHLAFSVSLGNGQMVHYLFYSRQSDVYSMDHINLLNRLTSCLTNLAEKMIYYQTSTSISPFHTVDKKSLEEWSCPGFLGTIGSHHLLLAALDLAAQVAPYTTSVLILGESGTGKGNVAKAIHALSPRRNAPFIKVNCGAIPTTLIESELFGHEKGAYTGAVEKRIGRFEQADGGSIFLDEIGELPLEIQVKLLRVLQEKEFECVGGSSPRKVDVRIIAATNRNLEKEVAEGNFRLDLYYRLSVFPITLPPLRDRKSDIAALSLYFASKFCEEFNREFSGIAAPMIAEMNAYNWPGNIRELENVLERSVILNDGKSKLELKGSLTAIADELSGKLNLSTLEDVKHIQRETERECIISVLKKAEGRIRGTGGAAELLNIKPTTLEAKMAKLGIKRQDFMDAAGNQ